MNRLLAIAILVFVGCQPPARRDYPTITADIACETAIAVLRLRKPATPEGDNKPKPGDKCPNCDGRGFIGDGTVRVKCEPCDGTGKVR